MIETFECRLDWKFNVFEANTLSWPMSPLSGLHLNRYILFNDLESLSRILFKILLSSFRCKSSFCAVLTFSLVIFPLSKLILRSFDVFITNFAQFWHFHLTFCSVVPIYSVLTFSSLILFSFNVSYFAPRLRIIQGRWCMLHRGVHCFFSLPSLISHTFSSSY